MDSMYEIWHIVLMIRMMYMMIVVMIVDVLLFNYVYVFDNDCIVLYFIV